LEDKMAGRLHTHHRPTDEGQAKLLAATTLLAAVVATVVVTLVVSLWAPPGAAAARTQRSYLALGNSLAFGYQQAKFNSLFPNVDPAAFDTGYVDDFGRFLVKTHRDTGVVNDGCPGETTDSFIAGPCRYQLAFPLHHPYVGGPASSQLADALAYLHANPDSVSPITLDIGANDALAVTEGKCDFEPACIADEAPALFAHIATNLGLILGDLRGAAPDAKIVVLGLYNPFGSTLPGADQLTAQLNGVMARAAAAAAARFADPLPVFNPPEPREQPTICLLTNMCTPLTDIHPTDLGYAVLADLVLRQYLPGPPFLAEPPAHGKG
jgi:lysophospholipase L1-like esterase